MGKKKKLKKAKKDCLSLKDGRLAFDLSHDSPEDLAVIDMQTLQQLVFRYSGENAESIIDGFSKKLISLKSELTLEEYTQLLQQELSLYKAVTEIRHLAKPAEEVILRGEVTKAEDDDVAFANREELVKWSTMLSKEIKKFVTEHKVEGKQDLASRIKKSAKLMESTISDLGSTEDIIEYEEQLAYFRAQLDHMESLLETYKRVGSINSMNGISSVLLEVKKITQTD